MISATRVGSIGQAKVVNCWPNDGSLTGMPIRSAMANTAPAAPARAHSPAAMPASRVAVTRRFVRVVSGTRYAAWMSRPIVAAAARSWTTRA